MARFTPGQAIATRTPSIVVDAGLEPGKHRFQLEVVASDRRRSKPDVVVVEIVQGRIFEPLRPDGRLRPIEPVPPDGPLRPTRPDGPAIQPVRLDVPLRPGGSSDPIPE